VHAIDPTKPKVDLPVAQAVHVVDATLVANVFTAHFVQAVPVPEADAKVPATQSEQLAADAAENLPASQFVQAPPAAELY